MKTQQVLAVLLSALCLSVLVSCNGANVNSNVTDSDTLNSSVPDSDVPSSELEATPSSHFNYTEVYNEEGEALYINIVGYIEDDETVVIPEKINGLPVKAIAQGAFMGKNMIKVIMPDTIEYIGAMAFMDCKSIINIKFSDNITEIGVSAFQYCISLQKIDLPKNLEKLHSKAFRDCDWLRSVTIPKTLTHWGTEIFMNDYSLMSVTFEDGLKEINTYAGFAYCLSLVEMNIPDSVIKIGDSSFAGIHNLRKVTFLGDAPTELGNNTFGEPNGYLTIYYDPSKSGWNETLLQQYILESIKK